MTDIVNALVAPLEKSSNVQVTKEILQPDPPYPFPWSFFSFFNAFPESVGLIPPKLKKLAVDPHTDFDLIILSYQTWFLSPSLPMTAFLKSEEARLLLKNRPVITPDRSSVLMGRRPSTWAIA